MAEIEGELLHPLQMHNIGPVMEKCRKIVNSIWKSSILHDIAQNATAIIIVSNSARQSVWTAWFVDRNHTETAS